MRAKRNGLLLALFLLVHLAVLASQSSVRSDHGAMGRMALRVSAPMTRLVEGVSDLIGRLGSRLQTWGQLRRENESLRAEVEELRYRLMWSRGVEGQLERLSEALDYRGRELRPLAVAQVVLVDTDSWLETLLLHTPDERFEVNQPVVAPAGVVGRVIQVSGPYAKVQLLIDRNAAAGARIERTRRQGLAAGTGERELALRMVPRQEDVRVGDRIVTSGTDGIYPTGLPIGTVSSVEPGPQMLLELRITPAVDYRHLEQVYVLPRREIPPELRERDVTPAMEADASD